MQIMIQDIDLPSLSVAMKHAQLEVSVVMLEAAP